MPFSALQARCRWFEPTCAHQVCAARWSFWNANLRSGNRSREPPVHAPGREEGCHGAMAASLSTIRTRRAPPTDTAGTGAADARWHSHSRAHLFLIQCWPCAQSPDRIRPGAPVGHTGISYSGRELDCRAAAYGRDRTWLSWLGSCISRACGIRAAMSSPGYHASSTAEISGFGRHQLWPSDLQRDSRVVG